MPCQQRVWAPLRPHIAAVSCHRGTSTPRHSLGLKHSHRLATPASWQRHFDGLDVRARARDHPRDVASNVPEPPFAAHLQTGALASYRVPMDAKQRSQMTGSLARLGRPLTAVQEKWLVLAETLIEKYTAMTPRGVSPTKERPVSQKDRTDVVEDLRLLRTEYVSILAEAKGEERRAQLELLVRHIDDCIREEGARS